MNTNIVNLVNDRNGIACTTTIGAAFYAAETLNGVTEIARVGEDGLVIETYYFIDGAYHGVVKAGEMWGKALTAAIHAAAC